ncbi:ABC transporter substrate-binding protein [Pseudomonas sp. s4]|uniref:ABC transporter substrate-binding protein n=1 Tax=Pseudomonas juntendi TaxID=2666183 RepID=A0AAJ5S9W2_9PSED|nr:MULTISPECIES: ABC transporter substrate-binding protein [Pseudomonas]MCL8329593.1 ABC transporter substrate-binding protein [Pseudomonas juntendi]MDH1042400.1 ABC transporter substrate-binding protein [Pseudomonas juntendi]OAK53382.1 hypothetical protein A3K88_07945 [Pseudomonas putida]WEA23080.1 ABC transporter substrate-binding protein [Pseudomonas juntendi]
MKNLVGGLPVTRRNFLRATGIVAGTAALATMPFGPLLAAERTIKIGYVSPQTGPLAPFAAADQYILQSLQRVMSNTIGIGGKTYKFEVVVKDSQSNPNRAAEVASELILSDKVDLMLVSSTSETTTDDFSAQLSAFKKANTEIVTGVVIPPDLTTFWTQARQQNFEPKIVSVGKALLFPSAVETLGKSGHNLSTEVWWSPNHPFSSSLTGASSSQLANEFTQATGKQWTQPLGFVHALFELAVDILKRTEEVGNPEAVRDALRKTRLNTVVGPVNWSDSPSKNVAKTPLVGGQWRMQGSGKFDLVITSNASAAVIPVGGEMQQIVYR